MDSFTMKMSLAQIIESHGLPYNPNPPWALGLIVDFYGPPGVPWYLCRQHGRGFYCELCGFRVGSYPVRPRTAAPPLKIAVQPAANRASQPAARQMYLDHLNGDMHKRHRRRGIPRHLRAQT